MNKDKEREKRKRGKGKTRKGKEGNKYSLLHPKYYP